MNIPYLQNENCRCINIFSPEEQEILAEYRKKHFPKKIIDHRKRRLIGKCPLTPEEVLDIFLDVCRVLVYNLIVCGH
jgi:hypothetical protein